MSRLKLSKGTPGLLVSVRNADEAGAALAGGADVIDVKEPDQGSLGAADDAAISAVVREVAGRAPVSAALGELVDLIDGPGGSRTLVAGVSLFKAGLARCSTLDDWQMLWRQTIAKIANSSNVNAQAVAVAYADWQSAQAPSPQDVFEAAIKYGCPALLVDTWDKSCGTLFDHWAADDLQGFVSKVQSGNIAIVLAGSLTLENVVAAARLAPDLVAVRTAACEGGRTGMVSERKVRELKIALQTATRDVVVV